MSNFNTLRIGLTASQTGDTRGENGRWLPTVEARPSTFKSRADRKARATFDLTGDLSRERDLKVNVERADLGWTAWVVPFTVGTRSSEAGTRKREAAAAAQVQTSRTIYDVNGEAIGYAPEEQQDAFHCTGCNDIECDGVAQQWNSEHCTGCSLFDGDRGN